MSMATSSDVANTVKANLRRAAAPQQRPGRGGQFSKVRLECALIAGLGGSALPST